MILKNKYAIAINKARVECYLTIVNDGEIAAQTENKIDKILTNLMYQIEDENPK